MLASTSYHPSHGNITTINKQQKKKLTDLDPNEHVGSIQFRSATSLFNKLRPNVVSSQFIFTVTLNGSEHFPSVSRVIRHGFELLNISPVNRKRKPDASSILKETGISVDKR